MSLADRFRDSLARSRAGFISRLHSLFSPGELDDAFYEQLEEILIGGDTGVRAALKLVEQLKTEAAARRIKRREEAGKLLEQILVDFLAISTSGAADPLENAEKPGVILLVGVNGSGKTTSAAKLAHLYRSRGKKVLLVAGDTFRAAAVEQLEIWAQRAGADLIRQQSGADPSALFFDALNAARARGSDLVIGDTAGRLHTKSNLMEELNKIYRVIGRSMPGAPQQVLLVIDAGTGHNAIAQAESFNAALPLTGIILTKLDGTARGGIVFGIREVLKIPICYIGAGEKIEDLLPFNAGDFARAFLEV